MTTPILLTLMAALVTASAVAGYAWSGSARSRGPAVTAAVTGAVGVGGAPGAPRALLSITLDNPGPGEVRVTGYTGTRSAGAVHGIDPPDATVNARESVDITVDVALPCHAAGPLTLPDLIVELPSGARRPVTAVGAPAVLTDLCGRGSPENHPLWVMGVRDDGARLVVEVTSPGGRRTRVDQVSAGGVVLAAGLPTVVNGSRHGLHLQAPATCPQAWLMGGVPTTLLLEVDTGGPAAVTLAIGEPLVRWVLATSCVGAGP